MRTVKHHTTKRSATTHKRTPSIPKWLECTWRRLPCGKQTCPVCSLLTEEQQKMAERGEAEEFILDTTDDLRYSIAEGFLHIIDTKNEMRSRRKDTKSHARFAAHKTYAPRRFALYRRLDSWHDAIHDTYEDGEELESMWTQSSDAADLDWYVHILLDYTHRQLEYAATHSAQQMRTSIAAVYARGVIKKVVLLVTDRLTRLALLRSSEKGALMVLMGKFEPLKIELANL